MSQLTSAMTDAIMAAARAHAAAIGSPMTIVVTDAGGVLAALHRMDGAKPACSDVAHAKARSSALFQMPTSGMAGLLATNPGLVSIPNMLFAGGGVPIMVGGECLCAVGASGGSEEADEAVARAGIAAIA